MHYSSDFRPLSKWTLLSWVIGFVSALGGVVLNGIAYRSADPFVVTLIFMAVGSIPLLLVSTYDGLERRAYILSFLILWFMAGIAALYANIFDDYEQNYSDAAAFYIASTDGTHRLGLDDINQLSVGAFAIVLWGIFYDVFRALGLGDGKYIGIAWNITAVALTGVIAVRIARLIFGDDPSRINRLIIIYVSCGLFWLFASMHLRDALGLLLITGLIYIWAKVLVQGALHQLIVAIAASALLTPVLASIRPDFIFVPTALLLSAVGAAMVFSGNQVESAQTSKAFRYLAVLLGLLLAMVLVGLYSGEIVEALEYRSEGYKRFSDDEAADSSLGNRYIVQASWPIRLILGSAYLFVFPIPVWSGFQTDLAYHLFKSIHAIIFYFIIPLFGLAVYNVLTDISKRSPVIMFLLISFIGFTMAVALTSVETRHWGAFLVPMMIISIIPDLRGPADRRAYLRLLKLFIFLVVSGHLFWAVLKFGY